MTSSLAHRTILVTADRRAEDLGAALQRRGARIMHAPMMSTVPHVDDPLLIARTRELLADPPSIVVVTTAVGLRGWLEAAEAAGLADRLATVLQNARLLVRGPKARGALQANGLRADWVAASETTAEIRDLLLDEGVADQRIAVQHHGAGADGLDEALVAAGAEVCSLVVYRWGPPPDEAVARDGVRRAAAVEVDAAVFTSAPAARAFLERAETLGLEEELRQASRGRLLTAAVGPVTAAPLLEAGLTVRQPERYRMGALVRLVADALGTPTQRGV